MTKEEFISKWANGASHSLGINIERFNSDVESLLASEKAKNEMPFTPLSYIYENKSAGIFEVRDDMSNIIGFTGKEDKAKIICAALNHYAEHLKNNV